MHASNVVLCFIWLSWIPQRCILVEQQGLMNDTLVRRKDYVEVKKAAIKEQ